MRNETELLLVINTISYPVQELKTHVSANKEVSIKVSEQDMERTVWASRSASSF